jgi:hypothetical protein
MSRPVPAFIERRSEPRTPSSAPARLLHGDKLALWADCVIRDLSSNGAKIELSHFYKVPPRFVLLHFQAGVAYEAVLKWRRGDLAGMAFEARHSMEALTEPRLEPVRQQWIALQPGFRSQI